MNFKLLFPVYRSRYKWIEQTLLRLQQEHGAFEESLSLGCGEGEGDPCIAYVSKTLFSCDINEDDVAYAKNTNATYSNIIYSADDATKLSFADAKFDLVVSSEVIEHVGEPAQRLLQEVSRILKPNALSIITYPSKNFPITYDPINRIAAWFGKDRLVGWGAYAFGHDYLIDNQEFRAWCAESNLEILEDKSLSGHFVGLLEIYWTGVLQSIFKKNAKNLSGATSSANLHYRPSFGDPLLGKLTAAILWLDNALFLRKDNTVLKGYVLRKKGE
jgi:2-polyprenyl-3-methyl-5-hydroxy-6-metoxy-1,4-benzoquinol methylase